MKNKKKRNHDPRLEGTMPNLGVAASATDFTGLIPAAGEASALAMDEMYSELYGLPDPISETPDKGDTQARNRQK